MRALRSGRESLTIGVLAGRAGVGVETIRFYERRGLLRRPARPGTGYRVYPEDSVARIHFIRHAQALGFTLDEIAALLGLRVAAGSNCAAVRARAAAKLADVEGRIAKLESMRAALEKLVAACPGRGAIAACTILEALDTHEGRRDIGSQPLPRRKKGSASMKSLEVKIDGMHCDGCASTVQALLSHEPGVKSVAVSFDHGKASVLYDERQTDPTRLTAAIERAGYRAAGTNAPGK